MDLPRIEDDIVMFDGGPSLMVRRARYASGRQETWVQTWSGDIEPGCRCVFPDGDLGAWSGGKAVRLPDRLEMSLRHANGLWSGWDATAAILDCSIEQMMGIRDGDASTLPFDIPACVDFEIVAAIAGYLGMAPDFDAIGMVTSSRIDEARLASAREIYSSIWMKPPGAGIG